MNLLTGMEVFMRPHLLLLSLVAVFFLTASPILAQKPGTGTRTVGGIIDVQLRYANGERASSGIHVRLESPEGGSAGDCQTMEGGKCTFTVTSNGVYTISVNERGYQPVNSRVEIIGTPRGYAMLELKPVSSDHPAEATSAKGDTVSVGNLAIPPNAKLEFDKGEEALKANQAEESAKHFEKATKLYGNYPDAYRMLGEAYLQSHDLKNAEASLKKSIELEPKIAATYVDLGAVQNQLKDYPSAETSLKQGLELSPDAAAAKYELAKTYWAMSRWQDAAPFAQEAVTALPTLASARILLGNIMLKQRNAPGALEQYQEYLRLEPNGAMAPAVRDLVSKIQKALQK